MNPTDSSSSPWGLVALLAVVGGAYWFWSQKEEVERSLEPPAPQKLSHKVGRNKQGTALYRTYHYPQGRGDVFLTSAGMKQWKSSETFRKRMKAIAQKAQSEEDADGIVYAPNQSTVLYEVSQ